MIITQRLVGSISTIFRTRTSSIIYRTYIEMSKMDESTTFNCHRKSKECWAGKTNWIWCRSYNAPSLFRNLQKRYFCYTVRWLLKYKTEEETKWFVSHIVQPKYMKYHVLSYNMCNIFLFIVLSRYIFHRICSKLTKAICFVLSLGTSFVLYETKTTFILRYYQLILYTR